MNMGSEQVIRLTSSSLSNGDNRIVENVQGYGHGLYLRDCTVWTSSASAPN